MSINRWKLLSMPVVLLGVAAPMLVNCGAEIPGAGGLAVPDAVKEAADAAGGCDEFGRGDIKALSFKGDAKADGKVKAFLQASYDINKVTVEMEQGLIASCSELGKNLGMSGGDLKAEAGGGKGAEKVCGAVAAKIQGIMKANADAKLAVEFDPPKCYADVEGMAQCLDQCGSPIEPGKLEASCEGGEISGKCDAQCKGKCTVDAGAQCNGTCKASCSGKCEANFKGTCGGKCDGKCDGKNTSGECKGTCEGKCDAKAEGTCGGTCEGSCSATCEMKAAANCQGSCSGGCSAQVKEPKCSGDFKPPQVDPSCQQTCANRAAASAKCDPANVRITANGKVNSDINKLIGALNKSLPTIVKLQMGAGPKLKVGAEAVVRGADGLIQASSDLGGKALACIKAGAEATTRATSSIDVNVKASVSVSASASGKVGGS
ncbi:hypothetical protein [Polyangium aurulentum]|uniref:hypothetical protein n=1 Tax=Polyangium aurulentum TaxID=2567896 RepID=UPI001F41FACB|nr:hypothetical protein [Polyangium aurulentum]